MTDAIPTPPPAEFDEPTEVDASILAYNRSGTAHELEGFQLGWLAARRESHAEISALRAELKAAKQAGRKEGLEEAALLIDEKQYQATARDIATYIRALAEQEVG